MGAGGLAGAVLLVKITSSKLRQLEDQVWHTALSLEDRSVPGQWEDSDGPTILENAENVDWSSQYLDEKELFGCCGCKVQSELEEGRKA